MNWLVPIKDHQIGESLLHQIGLMEESTITELRLIHVVPNTWISSPPMSALNAIHEIEDQETEVTIATNMLKALVLAIEAEYPGLQTTFAVACGDLTETVISYAHSWPADGILMMVCRDEKRSSIANLFSPSIAFVVMSNFEDVVQIVKPSLTSADAGSSKHRESR